MKVSVIIPVYNVLPFLERCVSSVLNQTCKDLEILLIDDGSTDGSGSLCDQIAAGEPRIRVVHQQNMGLSGARNTGIREATGDYVVFLDSDDEWLLPDGLETLLAETADRCDLVVFKRVDIWNRGQREMTADYDIASIHRLPGTQDVFAYLVAHQQLQISACFLMVRRQLLTDNDIYFPLGLLSEDIYWSMQLWQHVKTVRFTNLNLYGYYHREASITNSVSIRTYVSYDQIFSFWKEQCEAGCVNADAIRAYLANMWVSRGYLYLGLADSDKPQALQILQKHADLLDYACSPKAKRVRSLVQHTGVRVTATILGCYWRLRNVLKH